MIFHKKETEENELVARPGGGAAVVTIPGDAILMIVGAPVAAIFRGDPNPLVATAGRAVAGILGRAFVTVVSAGTAVAVEGLAGMASVKEGVLIRGVALVALGGMSYFWICNR